MKKFRKVLVFVFVCIMFVSSNAAEVRADSSERNSMIVEVELANDQIQEVEFVEVEDGVFEATIPIVGVDDNNGMNLRASSSFVGALKIKMGRSDTIYNLFQVTAKFTANSFFNGTKGTFTATSTSILYPKTYVTLSMNKNFTSTTVKSLTLGSVVLPVGETSRLKATGVQIYSLTHGWISGITFNTVFQP